MNVSDDDEDDSTDTISVISAGDLAIHKPNIKQISYCVMETNDIVELSFVQNHRNLFVRPVKYDEQFVNMMTTINRTITHQELSPTVKLKTDDVVLVRYSDDFCRGVIVDSASDTIQIQLLDFGQVITAKPIDIRFSSDFTKAGMTRFCIPVKLNVPEILSEDDKSAVIAQVKKFCHNRFQISSPCRRIEPNSVVDLLFLSNNESITDKCLLVIKKKFYISDIQQKNIDGDNIALLIVENQNLHCGLISCVLKEDEQQFANRFTELTRFGRANSKQNEPYLPLHLELCIVLYPDPDGTECWYRAQYQQTFANNRAQVGLIDFGITVIVEASTVRVFEEQFAYNCLTIICKLRSQVDMELLDDVQFANFNTIDVQQVKPMGKFHDIFLSEQFFVVEDDYI